MPPITPAIRRLMKAQGIAIPTASSPEQKFARIWKLISGAPYVSEYRFHETRKFRFDFAWPAALLGLEIDGGNWMPKSGHHGAGKKRDAQKDTLATANMWQVLRWPPEEITIENCKTINFLIISKLAEKHLKT